jgi:hypothetical protein
VSKIVIGALTAAVWFALSYVAARAESIAGQVCDQVEYGSTDPGLSEERRFTVRASRLCDELNGGRGHVLVAYARIRQKRVRAIFSKEPQLSVRLVSTLSSEKAGISISKCSPSALTMP